MKQVHLKVLSMKQQVNIFLVQNLAPCVKPIAIMVCKVYN